MAFLKTALLALAASTYVSAEHLKVVFSSGGFSTVSGTAGNENGHYNGFAIIRDDGTAIYNDGYPDNKVPCFNTDGGRTFKIEGDCWSTPRIFFCEADGGGNPDSCEVRDGDGNVLGSSEGKTDTSYIGIAIGQDSSCVVEFDSDDAGTCPEDDGDGPLHVTDSHSGTTLDG
ncbi:hypothetical protein BDV18DRAFT_153549 [Aspergillus unguis]